MHEEMQGLIHSISCSGSIGAVHGWLSLLLRDRQTLLSLKPDFRTIAGIRVEVVAPAAEYDDVDFEVRAFSAAGFEDPVTGSLNAGIAQWLIGNGLAPSSYKVRSWDVPARFISRSLIAKYGSVVMS